MGEGHVPYGAIFTTVETLRMIGGRTAAGGTIARPPVRVRFATSRNGGGCLPGGRACLRVEGAMARVIHIFRQPDRFVAGTVGEPGDRSFYLQASEDVRQVSVLLEKQQVAVLAERVGSLLDEVARQFGAEVPESPPDELLD